MKVSILARHARISGGGRILFMYASHLAKRGHDVTVYFRSPGILRRTVANFLGLTPNWIPGFSAQVRRIPEFSSAYLPDADVLIGATHQEALLLPNIDASKGRQFYFLQHDERLYHGPRDLVERAYRLPATKIVVSSWLADILRHEFDTKAALLINPIDKEQFHLLPRTAPKDEIRVLLLDHEYDWKGTAEGIAILERIKKDHPHVRLVGFGARPKDPSRTYDEYHFRLPQEKLAWLYSNSDIFLCPSWDEGFGLPSVEAMLCGAALVTYDNGGSRDYAFHEKTALVARHRDIADLENNLRRMIDDAALRKRLAKDGKAHAEEMLSWEAQTLKLEGILDNNP